VSAEEGRGSRQGYGTGIAIHWPELCLQLNRQRELRGGASAPVFRHISKVQAAIIGGSNRRALICYLIGQDNEESDG
jgi:hypothetical protein